MSAYYVILLVISNIWTMNSAMAEEIEGPKVNYPNPCAAYSAMLAESTSLEAANCTAIETFLVENRNLRGLRFFSAYDSRFKRASFLGVISLVGSGMYLKNDIENFNFLEQADKLLYSRLEATGDLDRAAVYRIAISNLKLFYLKNICPVDCSQIIVMGKYSNIAELGSTEIDRKNPKDVFECLIKSDSFGLEISKLVFSRRFNTCLNQD